MNDKSKKKMILAIETSCDETACAILEVRDGKKFPEIKTLSSVVKSQINLHKKMGGVVPEVAARAHVKNILPVTQKALADAFAEDVDITHGREFNKLLNNIDYIAVTQGPGLVPSLLIGVEFAKTLALATGKPIIPVNHMAGHLYSPFGEQLKVESEKLKVFPMISLIVSGGHTLLVLMKDTKNYKVIGGTVDDAAGEAFDKVAKLLGLPYPGGPEVSKMAAEATNPVEFPRPMIHTKDYNFSFSGLKTAVLYHLRDYVGADLSRPQQNPSNHATGRQALPLHEQANICVGFQNAAVDVLVTKTMRAAKEYKAKSISLSGGVSANRALRDALKVNCERLQVELFVPPFNLCTDNAEMIGLAAAFGLYTKKLKPVPFEKIQADPSLQL